MFSRIEISILSLEFVLIQSWEVPARFDIVTSSAFHVIFASALTIIGFALSKSSSLSSTDIAGARDAAEVVLFFQAVESVETFRTFSGADMILAVALSV